VNSGSYFAPTIEQQLRALRAAALHARGQPFDAGTTPERRAEILEYIANRIEVYANKAAANRSEP
jgi:acyl-CoA reductase-like NAD-dependent aldehyde dehydrogenase